MGNIIGETIGQRYFKVMSCLGSKWELANNILYRMCEDYPRHNNPDEIVAKIWLIGRSYAAAVERRRIKKGEDKKENDAFYYDVVAPKMLEVGQVLDTNINLLRCSSKTIEDNIDLIMRTHKMLMDAFTEITKMDKRSLASKYLHFHCPNMFIIYDSRAKTNCYKLVKERAQRYSDDEYDKEYYQFVRKMLVLKKEIEDEIGHNITPRELDSFVLNQNQ